VKTILIVEDLDLNIDLLTQILEERYALLIAKEGGQGLAMAAQNGPDLILMDISLPDMDGFEVVRGIRRMFAHLPIIGLSAHAMRGDAERALAAGFTDYLTKPVDEDLLLGKIHTYLGED